VNVYTRWKSRFGSWESPSRDAYTHFVSEFKEVMAQCLVAAFMPF